jgi:hypothetical protein
VISIERIVAAYYDAVSGPAGEERDWNRFRSLFLPEARLMTARVMVDGSKIITLTPDQFIELNATYFERGGYFERQIHSRIDAFGAIAHVTSTYESRRRAEEAAPYSRGVNSMHLLFDGSRWWIAGILWDYERPDDNPLPPEFLPPPRDG